MVWVIQYLGPPSCWIADTKSKSEAFDVTFQLKLARHFTNPGDAKDEILRLGLSGNWFAAQIGGGLR
jgi:hypothetical protein